MVTDASNLNHHPELAQCMLYVLHNRTLARITNHFWHEQIQNPHSNSKVLLQQYSQCYAAYKSL